jgi:two-component sensor histidine kinase
MRLDAATIGEWKNLRNLSVNFDEASPYTVLVSAQATSLGALVKTIVSPYVDGEHDQRIAVDGPNVAFGGGAVTSFALLLNEFATNAAKYGALSIAEGQINVSWSIVEDELRLKWTEAGGPPVGAPAFDREGFGSTLARAVLANQLAGKMSHAWTARGLEIYHWRLLPV